MIMMERAGSIVEVMLPLPALVLTTALVTQLRPLISLSSSAKADDPVNADVWISGCTGGDYWMPAFAGMTRKCIAGRIPHRRMILVSAR
jgi:hypothetical protein